jgi:pyruvate,water dikinase
MNNHYIVGFSDEGSSDLKQLGGKNASLGEMTRNMSAQGIPVPDGFAITADAYWAFLDHNRLRAPISEALTQIRNKSVSLEAGARRIRDLITRAQFPPPLIDAIKAAYRGLCQRSQLPELDVAVRSSATAEDLPDASFAGQQETFLNIRGEDNLLDAVRRCSASLFTDRAIVYRENHGFDHMKVALSVGVQTMVHSDRGCAGVMFSIDTETGFPATVLINGSWGLGEAVVQGIIEPDEYVVFKPLLNEPEAIPIIEKKLGTKARRRKNDRDD